MLVLSRQMTHAEESVYRRNRSSRRCRNGTPAPPSPAVRRLGVTEQTLYRWKKKYGGLQVNEAKRLNALEEENRQLKRLVAVRRSICRS